MKKLVSMALALSLCLAMFAGCGGTPSSSSTVSSGPSSSSEDTSTSGFENKELNIAIFEGGYGPEYWEEIVDRFEETYGVTVNMQISPTIGDIIRPQIVAGNVPDFISMNDNDTTGLISSMIRENALLDITDVFEGPGLEDTSPLKEQVLEGVLNTAKCSPYSDGKVYLAPFNASPMGLVYNKTLFEENGWELPETWDEFLHLAIRPRKRASHCLLMRASIRATWNLCCGRRLHPQPASILQQISATTSKARSPLRKSWKFSPISRKSPLMAI